MVYLLASFFLHNALEEYVDIHNFPSVIEVGINYHKPNGLK